VTFRSPIRILIISVILIVISHFLMTIFIKILPPVSIWIELLLDTVLIFVTIFPILYFSVFRQLKTNIDELKIAQEEILKLYRAVESSGEAIFITNPDGLIIYINSEFTNLYGFSADEVVGKCTPRILKSNTMPQDTYRIFWEKILNKEAIRGELINKTKDGRLLTIEGSTNPILNNKKDIIGFIGILFDISHGVNTTGNIDELLELIHQSLGKILYADNCFVALYDEKTALFNFPYFIDKFDSRPLPTAMAKSCTAYVFRTNEPLLLTEKKFNDLKEENEVELVGTPSPSWIGVPLQIPSKVIGILVLQHYEKENVYSDADVKLLVSIGNQIAISLERKITEEEIKLKNELYQAINAEKDKFFSIIAHDLRGPLSAFVNITQILTENIQSMSLDEIKDISISMKNDASNIYGLLENLLEWSQLKRGLMKFVPVRLLLKEKISTSVQVINEMAAKKKIEIDISVADNLEITADIQMFDTVIRNLISNAIKFTRTGGKISVSAFNNQEGYIQISISDTGIGMKPDLKSKLFLINEKTSRKGTDGEASSGLGLLLCKEFIEKHGGRIWVESEEEKGSTFLITLPEIL
jgi:PAS domain S-box-containing protein